MRRWAFGLFFVALTLPAAAFAQGTPKPRCAITVTPAAINIGDSVTLKWQATNVTGGTITGVRGGVGLQGSVNLIPSGSTRYVGFFNGVYGSATCEGIVVVYNGGTPLPVGDAAVLSAPPELPPPPPIKDAPVTTGAPQAKAVPPTPLSGSAGSGLIPCKGLDCQLCHLAALAQNIVNFLLGLSIPIAAAMFAYAGVLFFTSSVIDRLAQARRIFVTVGIGFLFILGAWLGVQTLLKAVLKDDVYRGWNTISCVPDSARPMNRTLGDLLSGLPVFNNLEVGRNSLSGTGSGASGASGTDLHNRYLLKANNIETVSSGGCADKTNPACTSLDGVDPSLITKVIQTGNTVSSELGTNIVLSGGTEGTKCNPHCNEYQNKGESVDIKFADPALNNDPAAINKLIQIVQDQGSCLVWETAKGVSCPAGVTKCLSGTGTGSHGSYYLSPSMSPSCK